MYNTHAATLRGCFETVSCVDMAGKSLRCRSKPERRNADQFDETTASFNVKMFNSFKRNQFIVAAILSIPMMVFISWNGLTLPFDFQPDPNYSHMLNALHLADTGRFENTFYPGVVNFYLMAVYDLLAGITLPSSPSFGIDSLQKATYAARAAQLTITIFAMWGWMYALSTFIGFKKLNERERFAYSIALVATLCFMMFSYAFIYQTYFLRPDNSLSLCIALGFALLATIRNVALESGQIKSKHLLLVGIWMFFMTATKSQGQAFLGLGILYVFYIAVSNKLILTASPVTMHSLRAMVLACLLGAVAIAIHFLTMLSHFDQIALVVLIGILTVMLGISFIPHSIAAVAALHITAAWCGCLICIYFLMKGMLPQVIAVANPFNTLINQMGMGNLKVEARPLFFHLEQAGIYGMVPVFLSFVGVIVFRKKAIFFLIVLGLCMIGITSLRLPGYYNGILYMPFFYTAAGLSIYYFLTEKMNNSGALIFMLLVGCHITSNIALHSSHMTALHAACLSKGSLVGARYDPDTVHLMATIRNGGSPDYYKFYLGTITNFDFWPVIRDKLKRDPKYQQLLDGTLPTCAE